MKQIRGVLIQNERNRIERIQSWHSADVTGVWAVWMTLFPPPSVDLLPYQTLCVTSFLFSDNASDRQLRLTDMPGCASTKWKAISFNIKKEVIARKEKGEGNTAIGRDLWLSESSVRKIWHKRDKIHASMNLQCTLISENFGDQSTNCHFLHRLHVSHRTISHRTTYSIDLLGILYEIKVYVECEHILTITIRRKKTYSYIY